MFGSILTLEDIALYDSTDETRRCFPWAMERLGLAMMSRGTDSTGMVTVNDGRIKLRKAAVPARRFFDQRPGIGLGAHLVVGHTRHGTQGSADNPLNNHPIQYKSIIGAHNGIIYNDDSLFRKNGWKRHAEVDSEAIFAALHHISDPGQALGDIEGWMAAAWIRIDDPNRLWLAKGNSSPLWIATTINGSLFYASTDTALKAIATAGLIPGKDFAKLEEIKTPGWMMSFDPRVDAAPVLVTWKPPAQAYVNYGSGSTTVYGGRTAWQQDVAYSWEDAEFLRWKQGDDLADVSLAEAVLGTHAKNVDELVDPFDEPTTGKARPSDARPRPTHDWRIGDRVVRGSGMIGTVSYTDSQSGQAMVEWDPSVEDFEDLFFATSDDEFETLSIVKSFMDPNYVIDIEPREETTNA